MRAMINSPKSRTSKGKARFYILDRAKSQDPMLANFRPYFNERWAVVDRETGRIVDEATTRYEARQARDLAAQVVAMQDIMSKASRAKAAADQVIAEGRKGER